MDNAEARDIVEGLDQATETKHNWALGVLDAHSAVVKELRDAETMAGPGEDDEFSRGHENGLEEALNRIESLLLEEL